MVSCLHSHPAVVAVVDKPVTPLSMELIQHGHGGVLCSSERGEFPVPLPRHSQKRVPPVHQVTRDEVVWVGGPWQGGRNGRGGCKENGEKHVPMLLHGLVHFGGEVIPAYHYISFLAGLAPCTRLLASFASLVRLLRSSPLQSKERSISCLPTFNLIRTMISSSQIPALYLQSTLTSVSFSDASLCFASWSSSLIVSSTTFGQKSPSK